MLLHHIIKLHIFNITGSHQNYIEWRDHGLTYSSLSGNQSDRLFPAKLLSPRSHTYVLEDISDTQNESNTMKTLFFNGSDTNVELTKNGLPHRKQSTYGKSENMF